MPKENLFKFVADHPDFLEQTIEMSRYNKWLNEEEILALSTISAFK